MVEFVGLGTDNVEVRPKCVFASMLERCIAEFGLFCRFRYLSEQKAAKLKQWSALPVGQANHPKYRIRGKPSHAGGTGEGTLRQLESSCASCRDSHNPSNGIEPPIR